MHNTRETPQNSLLANLFAGITVAYSCFPVQGLKKWWQSRQMGETLTSWRDYKLFRGSTFFAANVVPTTVIQLTTNNYIQANIINDSSSFYAKLFVNIICGMCGATFTTMVENVILRQQIMGKGPIAAVRNMLNQSILRPWKSYSLIATRDTLFTMNMFCVVPEVKKICQDRFHGNFWLESIARFGVGIIGTALSQPFDTMATRMQITHQPMSIREAYLDCRKNLTSISKKERPILCLYTGFFFRLIMFNIFSNVIPYVQKKTTQYFV
jgi:hypothetical protein